MAYEFVKEPYVDELTEMVLAHREKINRDKVPSTFMELSIESPMHGDSSSVPLSPGELTILEAHDRKMAEFEREHYFFVETITDVHRIKYIVRHRGGDEFPGFKGSVDYDALATEVLSKLRAGTYTRGSGAAYPLSEFERNVMEEFKGELKSGWLRKT